MSGAVSVYSKIPSLANFDTLIITGVTAKEWPGNLSNLTLISEQARERVNEYSPALITKTTHLMTLHEKRVHKEALLKRLFYCAHRLIVVSRPLADDKNRPLMESPSLNSALRSEDFVNIGVIRSNFSDLLPENSPYFAQIEINLTHQSPNIVGDAPLGVPALIVPYDQSESSNTIGAATCRPIKISALDDLIECPYLYWAKHIEKIKEPVTEQYNNMSAGALVHDIMEMAWKEKLITNKSLSSIVSLLWDAAEHNDDAISQKYKDLFSDKRLARRKNLLRARSIKSASLQDEIEERIISNALTRLEMKFEYDISLEAEGFNFTGRCDRLDVFSDGAVIIDYKTGRIPPSMLQLGSYALAAKMSGMEILGVGYVSLKEEKLDGIFSSPYSTIYTGREVKKNVEYLLCDTERKLSSAVQILKEGEFKPNYNSNLCRYCSYKPICRYASFRDDS
jgi:RecB family exonuclease